MTAIFFAFACAALGVLSLIDGGDDTALWFIVSGIWFHIADHEKSHQ